jgi:hypothetical protein
MAASRQAQPTITLVSAVTSIIILFAPAYLSARGDVIDPQSDNVAPTQLAIDGQVEHRQVTNPTVDLELGPDGPNMLQSQWRLGAMRLPLFHGARLEGQEGMIHRALIRAGY